VQSDREPSLLFGLLRHAASDPPPSFASGSSCIQLDEFPDAQFQWVVNAGMAPLLFYVVRDGVDRISPARRDVLRGADLTALVRHGVLIDATKEVIDACRNAGTRVTLLKGISISDQYYPAAHLRPMGDIDVFVSESVYDTVESAVLELGYRRRSDHEQREGAHHGAPLFSPDRRTWIEIHKALFSKGTAPRRSRVFSPSHVAACVVGSSFHGRAVGRFSDELQLIYIATSWLHDLSRYGTNPSFVSPLFDALYLLKSTKRTFDWEGLLDSLDNSMPAASLYVMLAYFSRRGLFDVERTILRRLASLQDIVGAPELRIVLGILHIHLIGGRPFPRWFSEWHATIVLNTLLEPGSRARRLASLPWNIVFPPSIAERYSIRFQLGRIARLLSRRA
jgi:hypothetical protein